jgi:signal transduction histidine kinase
MIEFFSAGLEMTHIDSETAINLYRLVQEALNNVKKHSGASCVKIRLVASYPNVILRIEDDGVGFDYERYKNNGSYAKHMGLMSMSERVHLLGGSIAFKSSPGHGSRIYVEVPAVKDKELPIESPTS